PRPGLVRAAGHRRAAVGDVAEQARGAAGCQLRRAECGGGAVARTEPVRERAERDRESGRARHDVRGSHQPARRPCRQDPQVPADANPGRARRLQRAELERGPDLQQRIRSGRDLAATHRHPDAAILQDHGRSRFLNFSMLTSRRDVRFVASLVAAFTAGVLGPIATARAGDRQKQVLVLFGSRPDAQFAVVAQRWLPSLLNRGLAEGVDYYSEFIDVPRFANTDYKNAYLGFLRLK